MEDYEKEEYYGEGFILKWFIWKPLTKKECEGVPEWKEDGGAYTKPTTEKEWKQAVLCMTDGGEIDCEVTEYDWDIEIGMDQELMDFLTKHDYFVSIKVEEDKPEPLTVSKMGRKKIVNVPKKSKLKPGDKITINQVKQ